MNNQLLIQGFSAFAGASFTFLFLRLAEFLSKVYERQVKHYNSLVILETEMNELCEIINDNLYLIPSFKETILSGNIYFSKLRQLPVDKSHYENLNDVHIINNLFSYNCKLRKINDDIDSLLEGYTEIKNGFIQHNITKTDYLINAKITVGFLNILETFLRDTENCTVELMVKVRLMLKTDIPLGTKIARYFIHTSGSTIKQLDIEKEKQNLLNESKNTKIQSQKEIEKILKNIGINKN